MKFDYQQNIRKLNLWFSNIDAIYLYDFPKHGSTPLTFGVCLHETFPSHGLKRLFGVEIFASFWPTDSHHRDNLESPRELPIMRARKAGYRMAIRRGLKEGHSIWSCSTVWLHKSHKTLRHNMANTATWKNEMSNDVRDALAAPIPLRLYSLKAICSVPRGSCGWYFRSGHCACCGWNYWGAWVAWCLW